MRATGLRLLPLAALLASAMAAVSYRGYGVYRLVAKQEQLPAIARIRQHEGVDFWSHALLPGHPVDVMVGPGMHRAFRRYLDRHGVQHQLLIEDVEEVFERERSHRQVKAAESRISFTEYHRYDEIRQYISDLASDYPERVTVQTIGQTYEGRPLDVIQVTSGAGGGDSRPVILVDAGIHAREWIAPAAALYVIQQLVENATDSALADAVDWHIVPVLNPDGYEYTFTTERLWRKTRSPSSADCVGVDANRNFDIHWMEIGASDEPCSTTFAGAEAFSEPETRALRDYILANADRIKLYLTFHSYGPLILYPWGYTFELPEDWETLDALGRVANAAQVAAGAPNYTVGTFAEALYPAAGTSADWAKDVAGVPLSYTQELPGGGDAGFDPPASDIVGIVTPLFEAVRAFGQYVADNFGASRQRA